MIATIDGSRNSIKFETKIQELEVMKAKNKDDSIQDINEEIFHDAQCSINDPEKVIRVLMMKTTMKRKEAPVMM